MHTVLIVDDEYLIAEILGMALEEAGFIVLTASSALKGLDILETGRPKLVITDYMMPGMNGAEFAKEIRNRTGFSLIPIVLITGGHAQRGKTAPALFNLVFEKPFEIGALIAGITTLLAKVEI
jgi:DNA-binding response OmpR family regulator